MMTELELRNDLLEAKERLCRLANELGAALADVECASARLSSVRRSAGFHIVRRRAQTARQKYNQVDFGTIIIRITAALEKAEEQWREEQR